MANLKDEMVIKTIQQIIAEVKQEMKDPTKKVLTEGKTAQQVFNNHRKQLRNYILKNILETLDKSKQ